MMTSDNQITTSSSPVYMSFDLFELLDACETLTDTLIECRNPKDRQHLYLRLAECLEAMETELEKPLPTYLIERLTAEKLVATQPQQLAGDSELLRQYCYALTKMLIGQKQEQQLNEALNALLFELVNLLIEDLLAPRFTRVNLDCINK